MKTTTTRRKFIKTSALGMAAVVTARPENDMTDPVKPNFSSRPNVLIVTTDQQCADVMSCAGNRWLSTPNMDRIARDGMRFGRAYCSAPVCVPSRASYMTGTMPHENGVTFNNHQARMDTQAAPCFARYLRDAGFDTGHFGKWHVPEPLENQDWSGFDTLGEVRGNRVDFDIATSCIDFITKPRGDRPFFAMASFLNPHDICQYARILSGLEDELPNGEIPKSPDFTEMPPLPANHSIPPLESSSVREMYLHPGTFRVWPTRTWASGDPRWRKYLWAYYRMTEMVDQHIGRILDALDRSGLSKDTLIIFTSDHGDGMGCHHWNQKTTLYDECVRIPFLVSWPGRVLAGGFDNSHFINLGTDLAATVLDATGVQRPAHFRGASVLPFAGKAPNVSAKPCSFVVSEVHLRTSPVAVSDVHGRMIRTARFKYCRYSGGEHPEQFFDMEIDPLETRNLAYDRNHVEQIAWHRAELIRWMNETSDFFLKLIPESA